MTKTQYNQQNHLITIKNEIKDDISFFQFDLYKIHINFKNNQKPYSYKSSSIQILKNPQEVEVNGKIFYNNKKLLSDIEQVLDFGNGYYRIFIKRGGVISSNNIRITENIIKKEGIKDIIEYLRTILDSQNGDEISKYLKREYQKLDIVLPDSVLNSFLSKKNKEKNSIFTHKNLIYPFDFNLSQKKALESVYESNISVIQGPPGTGKTQTILNIIANLAIMQDKTIAVVSNNNSAISNVKEKLEKENYDFFVSMLGNKENKEKFFNKMPDKVTFETESLDESSDKLEEISELMDINNKKHKLDTQLSDYVLEQQHFENYFEKQNIKEIFKLPLWTKNSDKLMEFLAENTQQSKNHNKKGLFFKIKLFLKYGFVEFKKLDTDEINLILSYQKAFYELKTEELTTLITRFNDKLIKNSYEDLIAEYIKYSKIKFHNKLNSKFKYSENNNFTKSNYLREFSGFINRFPVILSSTHAIVNSVPKGFLFDYLIIDESSQVDLTTAVLAFSCCKNVIIVGDTKQLQHITTGKKIENISIDQCFDYYKHNILSSVLDVYDEKIPVTLLKEHYRCHPKIINFCNQKYYNGELIIYTKETESDNPLTIYRSVEGNHMRNIDKTQNNGKYNQRELDIIESILQGKEEYIKDLENIGIITPFRKQVEKADEKFNKTVEVNTVHKFQGREKDTIIISTVLDNTKVGNIAIKFADQPSLINVAVSRAKNKLLVVTDNELFFKKGKELKDLIKYIEYSTLDENIIKSEIVGVFDLLYKNYSDRITISNDNLKEISKFKSENIGNALITKILEDDKFNNLSFRREVYLKNLVSDTSKLNDIEKKFLNTTSRVDFLIYSKFGKAPILVVEVDGVAYHENNPLQIDRDKKKNSILDKYNIPYLRLKTNGSGEEERVREKLLEIVNGY